VALLGLVLLAAVLAVWGRTRSGRQSAAADAYLQGRTLLEQPTRSSLEQARLLFKRALEIDPHHAAAAAGLADSYLMEADAGLGNPADLYPKARQAAQRALALDPDLAEARASLAVVLLFADHDFKRAEDEFRRALRLQPGSVSAHCGYALLLTPHDHLPPAVQTYLSNDPNGAVTIVGGEDAVSAQVQSELGIHYRDRIAGADRYATAAKLAEYLAQWRQMTGQKVITRVFLASGETFPDALAAAPLVAQAGAAILLARHTELPSATHDWLTAHASDVARVTAVGGQRAVADQELQQAGTAATT